MASHPEAQPLRLLAARATVAVSEVRRVTLAGREHIIVPVVAMIEGVRHPSGAQNPEFVPGEELSRSAFAWNGRVATIGHPERNGQLFPVADPELFDHYVIGHLFDSRVENSNGPAKLKLDAYLDVSRIRDLGGEAQSTLGRIQRGETVEISVGYWSSVTAQTGEFDGQTFSGVQFGIIPDHLAILPEGQVGACSVQDGCGAPRANRDNPCKARKPKHSGAEGNTNSARSLGKVTSQQAEEAARSAAESANPGDTAIVGKAVGVLGDVILYQDQFGFVATDGEPERRDFNNFFVIEDGVAIDKGNNRPADAESLGSRDETFALVVEDRGMKSNATKMTSEADGHTHTFDDSMETGTTSEATGDTATVHTHTYSLASAKTNKVQGHSHVLLGLLANVRAKARHPTFDGTENTQWTAPTLERWIQGYNSSSENNLDTGTNVSDLPQSARSWIANRTLLGESDSETFRDLAFFPVVNPDTNALNSNALRAVLSGRGSQADVPQQTLESAQNLARSLLEDEFQKMNSSLIQSIKKLLGMDCSCHSSSAAIPAESHPPTVKETDMSKGNEGRNVAAVVSELISNESTRFEDSDKEWLCALSEDQLAKLSPSKVKAEGDLEVRQESKSMTLNEYLNIAPDEVKEMVTEAISERDIKRAVLITEIRANKACDFTEEQLKSKSLSELVSLAKLARVADYSASGGGTPSVKNEDKPRAVPKLAEQFKKAS